VTTTHPDLTALLRAVCEFPDDDTPRLVLADWLDEHDEHERAEFIRLQCELARTPTQEADYPRCLRRDGDGLATGPPESRPCRACDATGKRDHKAYKRARRLIGRERELLTDERRHEWAPLTWARGFPVAVRCRMEDVLREQYEGHAAGLAIMPGDVLNAREWVLTPWAEGIARAHPVTRWEIADRGPAVVTVQGERFYGWNSGDGDNVEPYRIPRCVMDEFPETAWFGTEAEARDALARAVGRVVR
jgi:uncharacterized protein (TIGR02996 family)